jgi:hypothetical protein
MPRDRPSSDARPGLLVNQRLRGTPLRANSHTSDLTIHVTRSIAVHKRKT